MAYLDIDHFKQVNDSYGHDVGDELLKEVAARLQGALRRADTVARLGGDEFALILPDVAAADDVYVIASHIREALQPPVVIMRHLVRVNVSIGFAVAHADDSDKTILSRADHALYEVKRKGRNGALLLEHQPSTMSASGANERSSQPAEGISPDVKNPWLVG